VSGYNDIRAWLRQRRLDLGWSQAFAAARIGVSESTLANWENGDAAASGPNLVAWIHGLDCNVYVSETDPRREGLRAAVEALADAGRQLLDNNPWKDRT
jgi:transcriptional regulator with XRE-family HTH domain